MSRIYLVDDHALVREGLRAVVESAGHEVVGEADAPTAALADLLRLGPDLLLLDLHLGPRSGLELLAEIGRRGLALPVIVLSMSEQPRDVAQASRLGARAYVRKGAPRTELLQAIDAVVAGESYLGRAESELAARGRHEADDPARALSPRERQIVVMVARGASSTQIGTQLHLSPKTVDTYRSRLMTKLDLGDVPALVRWAIRQGLVSDSTIPGYQINPKLLIFGEREMGSPNGPGYCTSHRGMSA